jgi:hypothetical protein
MTYRPTFLAESFEKAISVHSVVWRRLIPLAILLTLLPRAAHAEIVVEDVEGRAEVEAWRTFDTPPYFEWKTDNDYSAGLTGNKSSSVSGASATAFWSVTNQGATVRLHAKGSEETQGGAVAFLAIGFRLTSTSGTGRVRGTGIFGESSFAVTARTGVGGDASAGWLGPPPYFVPEETIVQSFVWTDGPHLPGEPENPKEYDGPGIYVPGGQIDPTIKRGASTATDTTGAYLTSLPVEGSYGVTAPVYFGNQPAALALAASNSSSPNVVGYYFSSLGDSSISSFVTPDGIPGDGSDISISFGDMSVPYLPGTTYTFSSPVTTFWLLGLDPTVMPSHGPAPFVHGLTFSEAGPALVGHGALIAVPEPSACFLAATGIALLVAGRISRRRRS